MKEFYLLNVIERWMNVSKPVLVRLIWKNLFLLTKTRTRGRGSRGGPGAILRDRPFVVADVWRTRGRHIPPAIPDPIERYFS